MTHPDPPPAGSPDRDGVHLRLLWPQWQGAGTSSVEALAPEFPLDAARRGYAVGTAVLEAVLPPHDGPTATVPVAMSDDGLEERDGVEARRSSSSNSRAPWRSSVGTTRRGSRPSGASAQ